jgi:hypothetical protein
VAVRAAKIQTVAARCVGVGRRGACFPAATELISLLLRSDSEEKQAASQLSAAAITMAASLSQAGAAEAGAGGAGGRLAQRRALWTLAPLFP